MSYYTNFDITQGTSFDRLIYIQEQSDSGGPQNLTSYSISGNIQYAYAPAGQYLASFAASVYDGLNGTIRLFLTATDTANLPVDRLVYQVYSYAYSTPNTSKLILNGYVNVYPGLLSVIPSGLPTGCSPVTILSGVTGYYALTDGFAMFRGFASMRDSTSYYHNKGVYTTYGVTTGDGLQGMFIYNTGISNIDDSVDYIRPTLIASGSPGRYERVT